MAQQNNAANRSTKRRFSRPQFPVNVRIDNTHAQEIFERDFDITSKAVYYISVIMRVIDTEQNADIAEDKINKLLKGCVEDLKNRQVVARTRLDAEGYKEPEGYKYSDPLQTTVIIDSPRLQAYLGIIQELDNYIKLLDIAWFYGQITDKDRAKEIFKAKRVVVSVSTKIRELWNRVYRAAHAKNVTVEVAEDQSLTVTTPEAPKDVQESDSDAILLDTANLAQVESKDGIGVAKPAPISRKRKTA